MGYKKKKRKAKKIKWRCKERGSKEEEEKV